MKNLCSDVPSGHYDSDIIMNVNGDKKCHNEELESVLVNYFPSDFRIPSNFISSHSNSFWYDCCKNLTHDSCQLWHVRKFVAIYYPKFNSSGITSNEICMEHDNNRLQDNEDVDVVSLYHTNLCTL